MSYRRQARSRVSEVGALLSEEEVSHAERAAQLPADGRAVVVLVVQDHAQAGRGVDRDVRDDDGADFGSTFEVNGVEESRPFGPSPSGSCVV